MLECLLLVKVMAYKWPKFLILIFNYQKSQNVFLLTGGKTLFYYLLGRWRARTIWNIMNKSWQAFA